MRGTIGQQRADSACYIQRCVTTMQMAKAQLKCTLVFQWRSQTFAPDGFQNNRGYIIAPLVNKTMDCSPVVLSALRCTWQTDEPQCIARAHFELWRLRWLIDHLNICED